MWTQLGFFLTFEVLAVRNSNQRFPSHNLRMVQSLKKPPEVPKLQKLRAEELAVISQLGIKALKLAGFTSVRPPSP